MTGFAEKDMGSLPHVLIIDDDDRIRELVGRYLKENNFVAMTAIDSFHGREMLERFSFDALVVDVMMPGETGLDFTKTLREKSDIPVLLLTALGDTEDRISGLECGADDYLSKPFEPRELVLRLQAILRRRPQIQATQKAFIVGRWRYNPAQNELVDDATAEVQRLTTVEANLLQALATRSGEVVSRNDLAELCDLESGERTIDVQVTRLRRKIESDTKTPRYLQTVRGKGYLLRVEES